MAKNLIPTVAKMLGVEMEEEFKINLCPNILYKFDMSGVLAQEQSEASWHSANPRILQELIYGSFEIIKLPWKPKVGKSYYSFNGVYGKWCVHSYVWSKSPCEYALLDKGWVFRTRKEAEDALPNIAKEFGVKYELYL